jgi:hypothetical protein
MDLHDRGRSHVTEEAPKERKSGEGHSPTSGKRGAPGADDGWQTVRARTPAAARRQVGAGAVGPRGTKCWRWCRGAAAADIG